MVKFLFSLLLIIIVHGVFDWYINLPQNAGTDVPSGKLRSLSFAPFREGFSPLDKIPPLIDDIDYDMHLLADKTDSIRTYSSLGGMQPTPDIARKYGIKMIQGAWLGNGYKDNKKEIEALIKSANDNPDVVKRVMVGNEVLLRGDMDVDRLIGYIRDVKRAVKQPVSYADVWSMYMKHPKLIKEVDFITIHILPYWEDEPVSVENASEHLEKVVKQVEDEARGVAPGKPILIGESGWPSAGRQRGMAIPGVVNSAKFIRGLIEVANHHGFDYNIVEAFNQPWKSNLEGVVGANWGLFSAEREAVFPLTGTVQENPNWIMHFAEATLLFLLIIALFFKKIQLLSPMRCIAFFIFVLIFSENLITLVNFLWYTSYSIWQRAYVLLISSANIWLGSLLLQRNLTILADQPGELRIAEFLRTTYICFIVLALYKTYGLAINGRYLSFPVEEFAIPVIGICGLVFCSFINQQQINLRMLAFDQLSGGNLHSHRDRLGAYFLSLGVIMLVVGETRAFLEGRDFIQAHPGFSDGLLFALGYTLHNQQLLSWLGSLCVLTIPFWNNVSPQKPADN